MSSKFKKNKKCIFKKLLTYGAILNTAYANFKKPMYLSTRNLIVFNISLLNSSKLYFKIQNSKICKMAQYALVKWVNYQDNDDLYDVKLLKELIKGTQPYKLNNEYRIKENDGKYYTALLLKIGKFFYYYFQNNID